jgi:hypothetical protein
MLHFPSFIAHSFLPDTDRKPATAKTPFGGTGFAAHFP